MTYVVSQRQPARQLRIEPTRKLTVFIQLSFSGFPLSRNRYSLSLGKTDMFPTTIRPNIKPSLNFPSQNPRTSSAHCSISSIELIHCAKKVNLKLSASSPAVDPILADESSAGTSPYKEKLRVVVKPLEKPRIVLKFVWMEKNIGIALDQVIPSYGTIPLSPYYFWPRKDAWEELKVLLESKPWISQTMRVHLLNQATDIINLWQSSVGSLV